MTDQSHKRSLSYFRSSQRGRLSRRMREERGNISGLGWLKVLLENFL